MKNINPQVNVYFIAGCGRCPLMNTPECKVHNWTEDLAMLRAIILDCGLDEELKWGVPVYTFEKNNVVILSALKDSCLISFPKGVLLKDAHKILTKPGENSQAARVIRFTNVRQIIKQESIIKKYIHEAVEIEKSGLKPQIKHTSDYQLTEELERKFVEDSALKIAFDSLTPGRRRGYILHFSQPKQSATRTARIEKCLPQIFAGKGLNDG